MITSDSVAREETVAMTDVLAPTAPLGGAELRNRRRRRMALEIERAAMELFSARGYSSVTVDDIASAADISRRTFFRYFSSKEDVLFGDPQHEEDALVQSLERRPADESPVRAMHASLLLLARDQEADAAKTQLRLQLMEQVPDIVIAAMNSRVSFQRRLTRTLAERMDVDETTDMTPALIVSLSMSAMYVAMWHWLTSGATRPLHEVVARALDDAAAGLTAAAAQAPTRAE
jgi:AcrR family transcriptional regulator